MKKLLFIAFLLWGVIANAQAIRFHYQGTEYVIANNDVQIVLDGNEWNGGITRDYNGRITYVNGTYIGYDYKGRLQYIGGITITYDYQGRLTRVGGLTLRYNWRGDFVGANGKVVW